MFTIVKNHSERIDITLSGRLDSAAIRALLDELLVHSAGIEHGQMLFDVVDFHWPSMGGLLLEFSRLPEIFKLMRRFDRVAVLTDLKWLQKASQFEGALLPGIAVKSFERAEKDLAVAWLERAVRV